MKRAGPVVGQQPHHQTSQIAGVNHLNRLLGATRQGHPAAARGPAHPVREPVLPVVRAGDLPGPHDGRPRTVPGHHVVFAGHLQRAIGGLGQLLGVAHRRTAWCVLVGGWCHARSVIYGVTGDEQVPANPVTQHVHRLPDVARYVSAHVDHRVPAAVAQRRVVTGVPVAGAPGHLRKQVGAGPAPAENGHLGTRAQGVGHDRPAHERSPAQYENAHATRG